MYLPLFPFTRAMSQSPCLHEVLTTATIMSKFCEEYVISLSRYCGKTLRQMNMGFFKARYVRDYVAAAKLKAAVIWAAEIAAVLILGIVLAVGYGKITVMQEGSMEEMYFWSIAWHTDSVRRRGEISSYIKQAMIKKQVHISNGSSDFRERRYRSRTDRF